MSLWSSTALMVFEILITVDQEVELVWKGNWTFLKTLYVTARYLGLATTILSSIASSQDHLNTFCDTYNVVFEVLYCIISAASDGLLVHRVCAMYGTPSGIVRRGISTPHVVLGLYAFLMLIFLAISIWNIEAAVGFQLDVENFGCFMITGIPVWTATLIVVATLVFDALLFILTVAKVLTVWKGGYKGALTNLLLLDGSVYFGQIFITSLVCTLFLEVAPPSVQSAALPWYSVLTPISAGRLFLNLKSMGTARQAISGYSNETPLDYSDGAPRSTSFTTIHITPLSDPPAENV